MHLQYFICTWWTVSSNRCHFLTMSSYTDLLPSEGHVFVGVHSQAEKIIQFVPRTYITFTNLKFNSKLENSYYGDYLAARTQIAATLPACLDR